MVRLLLALTCVAVLSVLCLAADHSDSQPSRQASNFEDPVLPLEAKRLRTEAEQDRVEATALYSHGRMLLRREDLDGALRRFQRAWRYDPDAVSILNDILTLTAAMKRVDEYATYAVIAQEAEPTNAELILRLAAALTARQQFDRALKLYKKCLELAPEQDGGAPSILVRMEMGRLYFVTGRYEEAAEQFAMVRDALDDPERFGINRRMRRAILDEADRTYLLLAETFLQAERIDEAEQMFRRADQAKSNATLWTLNQARIAAERDQVDKALELLDSYFAQEGSDGGDEPYALLGRLLEKKLDDPQRAQAELREKLVQLYTEQPEARLGYFLAENALEHDDLALAEDVYEDLLSEKATLDAYEGLIEIYRRQGETEKVLEALGGVVSLAGDVSLTLTLDSLGSKIEKLSADKPLVSQLVEAAEQRIDADADSLADDAALAIALLATATEEFDVAERFFGVAAEEQPRSKKAGILFSWGFNMFLADQYERAARAFRGLIQQKLAPPGDLDAYYYLAAAEELAGNTQAALQIADQAIQLSPEPEKVEGRIPWIMFRSRRAWILYHAKRYEEAEQAYLQLIDEFDDDHSSSATRQTMRDARLVLSTICVLQQRMPEAEEWLEQILDEFPEDVGALNDLGYLWADQDKRLGRALAMVRLAVESEPDNTAYLDSLGWTHYRLGNFEEAIKYLERAAEAEEPDGVILDHLGDAYLKNNQPSKALQSWQRAVEVFQEEDDLQLLEKTREKIAQNGKE